ncbi:hypothetical protein AB2427_03815 [Faecalibacterium prausnitzii]|uniref:hypothetical protein n=1 Tax=Faecalibacterium prausnitzii TaxID=853 RepID=UPI003EC02C09
MQALKAMLFGAKLPPQEEEPPQPVKPAEPEKSTPAVPVIAAKPDAEKRAGCSAGEACRADARDGVCRR